jgi:hypothetical protein
VRSLHQEDHLSALLFGKFERDASYRDPSKGVNEDSPRVVNRAGIPSRGRWPRRQRRVFHRRAWIVRLGLRDRSIVERIRLGIQGMPDSLQGSK